MWYNVKIEGLAKVEADSEEAAKEKVINDNYYSIDLTAVSAEPEYWNYGLDGPVDMLPYITRC